MPDNVLIGRLRAVGFAKRGAVPTSPIVAGTFTAPTVFPRYLPPFDWNPEAPPLESEAIDGNVAMPTQVAPGPASLNGKKINAYLQPNDAIANFMMAALGVDNITGDGVSDAHAHTFTRLQAAQLPVYDVWADGGTAPLGQQMGFAGMMENALDLFWNKAELSRVETEWNGMYYVPSLALSPSVVHGGARPLSFATIEVDINQDGVELDAQVVHIKIDNKVVADHVLRGDTTYASQIWSEGMAVNLDIETILTDVEQYNVFLNQSVTPQLLFMKVTAQETFVEGALPAEAYKFYVSVPQYFYRTAQVTFPTGVVRAVFTGGALRGDATIGEGGNNFSLVDEPIGIQYVNGIATPY